MPYSRAYHHWRTIRKRALDEIRQAHSAVSGPGPGRRYATQQINHAYLVLLAAQFQGYCRELHAECVEYLLNVLSPPASLERLLRAEMTRDRKLNSGNATPSSLGSDFKRLAVELWELLANHDARASDWRDSLTDLNAWRNAIAHQDFPGDGIRGTMRIDLRRVERWRANCSGLARAMDRVVRDELRVITGGYPW